MYGEKKNEKDKHKKCEMRPDTFWKQGILCDNGICKSVFDRRNVVENEPASFSSSVRKTCE